MACELTCVQCEQTGIYGSVCTQQEGHESWHLCNTAGAEDGQHHTWPLDGTGNVVCNEYCQQSHDEGRFGRTCHQDLGHGGQHTCEDGHAWD